MQQSPVDSAIAVQESLADSAVDFIVAEAACECMFTAAIHLPRLASKLSQSGRQLRVVCYWGKPAPEHLQVRQAMLGSRSARHTDGCCRQLGPVMPA